MKGPGQGSNPCQTVIIGDQMNPLDDLFWGQVEKGESDECWDWSGAKDSAGYGKFAFNAHRVAYTLVKGPIPSGLMILHECDNPSCCNPEHLRPGTAADNARDMVERNRTGGGRPMALEEEEIEQVIAMKARGVPNTQIAQQFKISQATVWRYLKSPEAQEKIAGHREIIRRVVMDRLANGLMEKVADAVNNAKEPRDVDATTRALLNLEKAATSASGEAKKLEMTGPGGEPLQIDVRAILARATGA